MILVEGQSNICQVSKVHSLRYRSNSQTRFSTSDKLLSANELHGIKAFIETEVSHNKRAKKFGWKIRVTFMNPTLSAKL